ncbi:heat shock factor protein 3 isoform X2 [Bombina bombina]|uniref:heat shock factor protein 3 isoform X2 n=1 Tax=Bombina bombina TaxID=8345 RepID=UPI00235A933B|nr:heat shock factor protein 3 isoform X2 [Bombina bombina]
MKDSSSSQPVPAFLSKLWALIEDPANCDVISWNWDGQNFCIRDEQQFCKEILPRYFKHNNLSSFIRQLNMYGFRKVMSLESGLIKPETGSAIEFQHPFFKKGKAELLEKIKRKVSAVKTEDSNFPQDDLHKVLAELQELKDVQSSMDTKLDNMRRENQALWTEVASLRRKHSQQQKLLAKILQFILSLMRGNIVMGSSRKRPLTIEASQSPPAKYSRPYLHIPEEESQEHPQTSADNVIIHEIPNSGEGTSDISSSASFDSQMHTEQLAKLGSGSIDCYQDTGQALINDQPVLDIPSLMPDLSVVPSSAVGEEGLALDVVQASSYDDPDGVINSILNENCTTSSHAVLDREEIQDFLSCIDASLEELQTMLSRKKINVGPDVMEELFNPDLLSSDITVIGPNTSLNNQNEKDTENITSAKEDISNKDKQLIQYTGNPVLSLFDELPSNDYVSVPSDPANLLTSIENDMFPSSSVEHCYAAPDKDICKETDLLMDDFNGSLPIFVLSPVNKLLDEVTEPETV